jgi:alpha-D-ribose 1-methylphosphonate 5-triphosphate synthase subunit PhnH
MSAAGAERLANGFSDVGSDSQIVFRALMRAVSEPGRIEALPQKLKAPAPVMPAAASLVLALCDADTTLWLSPSMALPGAAEFLRFHSDARLAGASCEAAFAIVQSVELSLSMFGAGTPAYPDRGTTVIVQCPSLTGGPKLALAGPGIAATAAFSVDGLPADFVMQAKANRARFPIGVDLVFVSGGRLIALPRSTRILTEAD